MLNKIYAYVLGTNKIHEISENVRIKTMYIRFIIYPTQSSVAYFKHEDDAKEFKKIFDNLKTSDNQFSLWRVAYDENKDRML